MKTSQRIFISDLPENATKDEVESVFGAYGNVSNVDIKKRKELTLKNKSLYFAYLNIDTDRSSLQKCFQKFANEKWHGEYINVQLAKESFLDRLKREREEANQSKQSESTANAGFEVSSLNIEPKIKAKYVPVKTFFDDDDDDDQLSVKKSRKTSTLDFNKVKKDDTGPPVIEKNIEQQSKVKLPKNNLVPENESTKKEPLTNVTSKDNLKRLQSLKNMKKSYQAQRNLIKNALSNIDTKQNNIIIFDDDDDIIEDNPVTNGTAKHSLFNDESDLSDDFEGEFKVKEQFEGEKGKKLLQLQSKYKNDKRFALDERFLESDGENAEDNQDFLNDSVEVEKKKELEILEEILGKKIVKPDKKSEKNLKSKGMLRYDPSQPDHADFEEKIEFTKRKLDKDKPKLDNQDDDNIQKPSVSKDVFYKVSDNLKETFQQKQNFSLLSTFKNAETDEIEKVQNEKVVPNKVLSKTPNPFRYDSSDDEDETEDIPHKSELSEMIPIDGSLQQRSTSRSVFWTESFFFKKDDYRLQEGFDFVEKMRVKDKEFAKLRNELKGVVRSKIRNSEKKNRMFKRKIGASKRKKLIRIKKALKR